MVVVCGGVREEFPGLVIVLGMVIEIDAVVHGSVAVDVLYLLFGTDDRALLDEFNHGRASIALKLLSWVKSVWMLSKFFSMLSQSYFLPFIVI